MLRNRLLYLAALAGGLVFYCFFYAWFSWYLLLLLLCLPWLSLLVSLPAMLQFRLTLNADATVRRGTAAKAWVRVSCPLPCPAYRARIRLQAGFTGGRVLLKICSGNQWSTVLPTVHCGRLICSLEKVRVYDYLGLFRLPRRCPGHVETVVLPIPQPPAPLPNLSQLQVLSYRPKPGGGFSEAHEMRDYRPGDSLREVHWKLTAKTDRPIIREAQEPDRNPVLLTLDLRGSPEDLDGVLDQLYWLSGYLLDHEISHLVHWAAAGGYFAASVEERAQLELLVDRLCRATPAEEALTAQDWTGDAFWHYHILPQGKEARL